MDWEGNVASKPSGSVRRERLLLRRHPLDLTASGQLWKLPLHTDPAGNIWFNLDLCYMCCKLISEILPNRKHNSSYSATISKQIMMCFGVYFNNISIYLAIYLYTIYLKISTYRARRQKQHGNVCVKFWLSWDSSKLTNYSILEL